MHKWSHLPDLADATRMLEQKPALIKLDTSTQCVKKPFVNGGTMNHSQNDDPELNLSSPQAAWQGLENYTIGQVLRETAKKFPDRDAVVFCNPDWRRSWLEFDLDVDRVSRALLAIGLRRGDHFGVWATNVPEWVLLQFATARIGVVLVTINPSY